MSFFEFMVYGFAIIGAMSVLFFALVLGYLLLSGHKIEVDCWIHD